LESCHTPSDPIPPLPGRRCSRSISGLVAKSPIPVQEGGGGSLAAKSMGGGGRAVRAHQKLETLMLFRKWGPVASHPPYSRVRGCSRHFRTFRCAGNRNHSSPLGGKKLTIHLTVRWNSHPVLSNSGGSPSVLPLVDLPLASYGVGIRDLGALKLLYLKTPCLVWIPLKLGRQTLKLKSRDFFSHSTADSILVNSNWSTVGLSWGEESTNPKRHGAFDTARTLPYDWIVQRAVCCQV